MQTARVVIDNRAGFYQLDEGVFTTHRLGLEIFIGKALSDGRYTNFDDARNAVLTTLERYEFHRDKITVTESGPSRLVREGVPSYV